MRESSHFLVLAFPWGKGDREAVDEGKGSVLFLTYR